MPVAKFKTIEELDNKIEEYFNECDQKKMEPNKAGLRLKLGICKDTYSEWKKKGHKHSDSIKKADDIIEEFWIRRLGQPACTGAIFYLKNAFKNDYRDRYDYDHTTKGEIINPIYGNKSVQGHEGDAKDIQSKKKN